MTFMIILTMVLVVPIIMFYDIRHDIVELSPTCQTKAIKSFVSRSMVYWVLPSIVGLIYFNV